MMSLFLLLLLAVCFFELSVWFRMTKHVAVIATLARQSAHALVISQLSDDDKEIIVRQASAGIFKATACLAVRFLAIVVATGLPFLLIAMQFPELGKQMREGFVSPTTIAILTIAVACYAWMRRTVLSRVAGAERG